MDLEKKLEGIIERRERRISNFSELYSWISDVLKYSDNPAFEIQEKPRSNISVYSEATLSEDGRILKHGSPLRADSFDNVMEGLFFNLTYLWKHDIDLEDEEVGEMREILRDAFVMSKKTPKAQHEPS